MIIHKKTDHQEPAAQREEMLRQLKNGDLSGSVVLHTCNRVEYFGGAGEVPDSVARHLFRLASGLESVFIGETFIQGQIKEAYQQASAKHPIDASLHRLFQWALLTGKRVRTETTLSRGAMSHSQAVVEIIRNTIGDYKTKRFAFIGVNKINKTIMNFLKGNVNNAFVLCNRTFETAVELEQQFNCKAYTLKNLKESLQQSDIVISATSAPHYIIKPDAIPPDHPLVIFDLAVPRDVDPIVASMPNVHYYSILEIEKQVNQNIAGRVEEVEKANLIVEEEIRRFIKNEKRHQKHLKLIHAQQERSLTTKYQILTT